MEILKLKTKDKFQIAADGSAASGKTTGAKLIAKKFGLKFLSSGQLYRYAAYLILKYRPKNKIIFLKKKFKRLNLKQLHSIKLKSNKISEYTSEIARENKIRSILKLYQKNFAKKYKKICIEGRDIGTVILPNADIKFFFICDLKTASRRRFQELKKKDKKIKFTDVKKSIKIRNFRDKKRKNSPLLKSDDAIIVNTGKHNNIKRMLKIMIKATNKVLKNQHGN
ncbi:MAG: cytidylate kinase [Pelagibacteraceae bacterium TMED216]|nr:MAG: cytidylate kinase [Pelagibacteraceae bacterium TMED216]